MLSTPVSPSISLLRCVKLMLSFVDAELIWQSREIVLQVVHSDVTNGPGDGQADGEEYGEKAELQERGDIYLEGLKFLLGDWRFAITGEKTALYVSPLRSVLVG